MYRYFRLFQPPGFVRIEVIPGGKRMYYPIVDEVTTREGEVESGTSTSTRAIRESFPRAIVAVKAGSG